MKFLTINILLLFILIILALQVDAGTCTSINYTSVSAGDIITSSKYNTDNTTLFNNANAYDGGCITSNTIEKDGLNTADFTNLYNGFVQGCELTRAGTDSLSIDKCMLSVNDNFVRTTAATSVDFTDLDTGTATSSTKYYVYADSSSSGSTLTPVVSIATPDGEGYSSNNKVIGSFWYNDDSNVASASLNQWADYKMRPSAVLQSALIDFGVTSEFGSSSQEATVKNGRITNLTDDFIYACYDTGVSNQSCLFATGYWANTPNCWSVPGKGNGINDIGGPCTNTNSLLTTESSYTFRSSYATSDGGAPTDTEIICSTISHTIFCQGIKN